MYHNHCTEFFCQKKVSRSRRRMNYLCAVFMSIAPLCIYFYAYRSFDSLIDVMTFLEEGSNEFKQYLDVLEYNKNRSEECDNLEVSEEFENYINQVNTPLVKIDVLLLI